MAEPTQTQDIEDWVEIVTADGERGRVTSATARHMITYHGARMATDSAEEPAAAAPADGESTDAWDDDGGLTA